jgi:[histone H3]-trimethyl-L-lysine4 demethylase
VDLPTLDTLERITDQLQWVEKSTDLRDVFLTLSEVNEIIDEGGRCGISPDHALMKEFARRRDRGTAWGLSAEALLANDIVEADALDKLLDNATDVSVKKETYEKVESISHKLRDVLQHITSLVVQWNHGSVDSQPRLFEARKLIKTISELPVKTTEIAGFCRMVTRAEDWVKRAKRMFGKSNLSTLQFGDHLQYVLDRNEKVFDSSDVPKTDGHLSPNPAEDTKESEEGPYCICRSGPTGEMVECDKCKEWYHMKCLKINKKKFDPNESWDCPICDWHKEIPRASTRPSLSELRELVKASESLPFYPDELSTISKIVESAARWVADLQGLIRGTNSPTSSIHLCRFYLRKTEGAEVLLPDEYNMFRRSAHDLAPMSSTPPPIVTAITIKKPRPRKPKVGITGTPPSQEPVRPHQRLTHITHIHADPQQPSYNTQQRLLPAQQFERAAAQPPLRPPTFPQDSHPSQPIPPPQSMPPKGVFLPPRHSTTLPAPNSTRDLQALPVGKGQCASCKKPFVTGEPIACSQCQTLHHTVCISDYGGRIYPAFVWYLYFRNWAN